MTGGRAPPRRKLQRSFVGRAQFTVLALEDLHLFPLFGRQAVALPAVDLRLMDTLAQGLGLDAELLSDTAHCAEALTPLASHRLEDDPDGPLSEFGRYRRDSMFLETIESPPKSGRFIDTTEGQRANPRFKFPW